VELAGRRVVADDARVVALWDPQLRYLPRRAGYHGGASLAEVTVPVLALLPLGAGAAAGWRPLGPQQPSWWSAPADTSAESTPSAPVVQAAQTRTAKKIRRTAPEPAAALFEMPAGESDTAAAIAPVPPSLVEQVLGSEMFTAQHALTPRKVPLPKIRGALSALVDANGVLSAVIVAERAGEQQARATGFITTLQRIFNVDNFPVLSLTDDGRTVRLNLSLLRLQFGLQKGQE
jgi:hypothetical protein